MSGMYVYLGLLDNGRAVLATCQRCGAVVDGDAKPLHDLWHDSLAVPVVGGEDKQQ
jgi:hypothetical protein